MRTRRIHMLEVARFYQRIENAKREKEKAPKGNLIMRILRRIA